MTLLGMSGGQSHNHPLRDDLAAFDLACIYIIAGKADTPCDIGAGRQLPGTRRIAACWWADDLQRAHDVVDMGAGLAICAGRPGRVTCSVSRCRWRARPTEAAN
jgi:hypothetical protein